MRQLQQFKLANVVFEVEDFLSEVPGAFYRAEPGSSCTWDGEAGVCTVSGLVDFATYFNGASMAKWRRYAGLDRVLLHIEVAGDACTVATRSLAADGADGPVASEVVDIVEVDATPEKPLEPERRGAHAAPAPAVPDPPEFTTLDIPMPSDAVIAGFAVQTSGVVRLRNAYYYVEVPPERIRPVRIALCTTTFRKESYILANIDRVRAGVFGVDEPIAQAFHMFVVDNGRTLDAEGISDAHVTVLPNPNAGGSGGFARGMMAAQDAGGFTHVLLMDDDVHVYVESFKRTFALLSLATGAYANARINGAMIDFDNPWMQYEDVAYARPTGGVHKVKDDLRIDDAAEIVRNELLESEVEHVYGGWWYSCIPLQVVQEAGLPLPFFIRCDDVEYGLRIHEPFMTMNGICVWHPAFNGRYNAAVESYQYVRNMLVMMSLYDFFDRKSFMFRYWRTFHYLLRTLDYSSAELWLDGLCDYLKGPEFLMGANCEQLMMDARSRAERFVPIQELDAEVAGRLAYEPDWLARGDRPEVGAIERVLMTIPHDRHYFPEALLSDEPGVLAPGFENFTPWRKTAMRSQLVALSADGATGALRTIDHVRYRKLLNRYRTLMKRYGENGEAVAARWRAKMPEMTSRAFWDDYLAAMAE